MLRSRAATTIEPINAPLLIASLPELARLFRNLEIDGDAVVDRDGRRKAGLRVETGTHPLVGTRYRLVTR